VNMTDDSFSGRTPLRSPRGHSMTWALLKRNLKVTFGRPPVECHREELTPIDCYAWFPGLDGYPADVFSSRTQPSLKWPDILELHLMDSATGTDGEDSPGFI
jgi:hypothetical protein